MFPLTIDSAESWSFKEEVEKQEGEQEEQEEGKEEQEEEEESDGGGYQEVWEDTDDESQPSSEVEFTTRVYPTCASTRHCPSLLTTMLHQTGGVSTSTRDASSSISATCSTRHPTTLNGPIVATQPGRGSEHEETFDTLISTSTRNVAAAHHLLSRHGSTMPSEELLKSLRDTEPLELRHNTSALSHKSGPYILEHEEGTSGHAYLDTCGHSFHTRGW